MNCAPCITRLFSGHLACPVPEKGVSGTEYSFRTVEACFLHRMLPKMRRVPQEPVFRTARIFRTVGGPFWYRISQMPERRKVLPAPNLSNCQKRGEPCLHRIYQTARKEKGMARNMSRNAAASKKITASVPKTHRQTAPQLKDPPQLHTRPTKSTSSIHSHPPGCPKSPLLKVQSASGPFWQG